MAPIGAPEHLETPLSHRIAPTGILGPPYGTQGHPSMLRDTPGTTLWHPEVPWSAERHPRATL